MTNEETKAQRRRFLPIIIGVAVVAAIVAIVCYLLAGNTESTDDAFVDGDIVPINNRIAGRVQKIFVSDNEDIQVGKVIAVLDASDLAVSVESANAALSVAAAATLTATAQLAGAQADVEAAKAEAVRRKADLDRYRRLDPRVVSKQQLDAASASSQSADASLRASETKAKAAQAQISEAEARVKQAQAALDQAKLNLSYGQVISPVAGRVTKKSVQLGQYLELGQLLMMVVPKEVWVTANFKENQISKMHRGQHVDITIDTYPGRKFSGHVDGVQAGAGSRFSLLPPENATGNYVKVVQRVPVKIVFDNPENIDVLVGPGMSVSPSVDLNSPGDQGPLPIGGMTHERQ